MRPPRGRSGQDSEEGSPTGSPKGNPSERDRGFDHSFTLQAVMQMQKDLGVLGEKIDRLRDDFGELKTDAKENRNKLTEVKESIATFKGALIIIGGLYTLVLVILGAFLAWYKPAPTAPISTAAPAAVAPQQEVPSEKNGAAEATPVVDPVPAEAGG
jgi:hypothetical protein